MICFFHDIIYGVNKAKNSKLSLRLILKFEQKYKHLDGYIDYAHLLLCQLNIV